MKVFLDTNVIASATATRGLCADLMRIVIEFHSLVVSEHLIRELRRVLKEKFGASPEVIADVIWLLHQDTISAESLPCAKLPLKDPADIAIVSSALNGGADILVTGDKEILGLKRVGRLQILTPRQFWDNERGQPPPRLDRKAGSSRRNIEGNNYEQTNSHGSSERDCRPRVCRAQDRSHQDIPRA